MEFDSRGLRKITPEERWLYTRKGYWENITLGDLFDRAVLDFPNSVALVCPDENISWTYTELSRRVFHTALALLTAGLKKGDRVIVQLPNWSEGIVVFYALQKIGATPIASIPRHGLVEIEHFCRVASPVAWLVPVRYGSLDYLPMIKSVQTSYPEVKVIIVGEGEVPGSQNLEELRAKVDPEAYPFDYLDQFRPDPELDLLYLMPTGGTTGLAKLVAHNHNTFICYIRSMSRVFGRNAWDGNVLVATPLMHNMAIVHHLSAAMVWGGRVTMIQSTRAEDILRTIEEEKITHTMLTPTQYADIINTPDLHKYDLSSLRHLVTAAAYCPPELARKVYELVGGRFLNCYGISEGGVSSTRAWDPEEVALYTQGIPVCGIDQRKIVDENGQELPIGEEGELLIKGPDVFLGYLGAAEENRTRVFTSDGFYHTGDLARLDARGNLTITGRKKDVIIRGGENIPVAEVENVIVSHPAVKNVAVVAMPDARLGEKVCAFIEPVPGKPVPSLEELVEYMKRKGCSKTMLPERLEVIEEMPVTGAGKIDKKLLRQLIADKARAEGLV